MNMKKLTIEQKAQRYDEAIEKARLVLQEKGNEPDGASILSELFPELIESKDERIRKDIINLVKKSNEYGGYALHKWEADKMLAWLEKQGGQKPYGQRQECVDCQFNYAGECKGSCAMKRGKQKPTEWSEEDNRILYNVKAYIGYAAGQRGVKDELFKEANEWLNSLPIGFVYNKNYNEDMVTLLVGELKQIANDNNAPEQYQVEINWLKSLKEGYTWKPSEKQIKVCKEVYADILSAKGFDLGTINSELNRLEEELKKLKG